MNWLIKKINNGLIRISDSCSSVWKRIPKTAALNKSTDVQQWHRLRCVISAVPLQTFTELMYPSLTHPPVLVIPGISASNQPGCMRCCTPASVSPPTTPVWKQPGWFMTRRSSGLWGPSCLKPASCLSGKHPPTTYRQSSRASLKHFKNMWFLPHKTVSVRPIFLHLLFNSLYARNTGVNNALAQTCPVVRFTHVCVLELMISNGEVQGDFWLGVCVCG